MKGVRFLILTICILLLSACSKNEQKTIISYSSIENSSLMHELALEYYGMREYEKAIECYQIILEEILSSDVKTDVDEYWIKATIANLYIELKEYNEAKPYIEDAIEGYDNGLAMEEDYSYICQIQGNYYLETQNYNAAIKYYQHSLQYTQEEKNETVQTYLDIATVYSQIDDENSAIENYETAVEVAERINDYGCLSNAYSSYGVFVTKRGDIENAKEYFKKGIYYSELKWGSQSFKTADSCLLLAKVHSFEENYSEAIMLANQAADIYEKEGVPFYGDLAASYINLSYFHIKSDNDPMALDFLQKAYHIIFEEGNSKLIDKYDNMLSQIMGMLYEKTSSDKYTYEEWVSLYFEDNQ